MIYCNTKIKDIDNKLFISIIKQVAKFCDNKFGCKKGIGLLMVDKCDRERKCYGLYRIESNEIVIYMDVCKTVGEFTRTFIHEWTHSLQPCEKMYMKLLNKYGYDNHPFEIEAVDNEKKYNRVLLKELRTMFGNNQ